MLIGILVGVLILIVLEVRDMSVIDDGNAALSKLNADVATLNTNVGKLVAAQSGLFTAAQVQPLVDGINAADVAVNAVNVEIPAGG